MWIFTTREIAIFIYAVTAIAYIIIQKESTSTIMQVIKTACNIKIVVPFFVVLSFSVLFVWGCQYLPFWDWVYVKDIVFWTIFAGVPICFNATSRNLEEHYFKNIVADNLKFAALVEFITGTFTFHIVIELILQPLLVIFIVLQLKAKKKSNSFKKAVEIIIGITGLIILILTIISIINSIGDIKFIDLTVGLFLPVVLSILYMPIAYFFALYAKYESLFVQMDSKEPDDHKIKRKHRIKTLFTCKLSYRKVCKFRRHYVQEMYVNMTEIDFDKILKKFAITYKNQKNE